MGTPRHKNVRPINDLVVKKVFRDERIALQFVKDIFEIDAVSAKILDSTQIYLSSDENVKDFSLAVDILVELSDGMQIIIEVQLARQNYFVNRTWAYICKQVGDNVEKLRQIHDSVLDVYENMPPVYAAAIVSANYFDNEDAINTFVMKNDKTNEVLPMYVKDKGKVRKIPLTKIIFIELKKYDPEMKYDYKKIQWIEFFDNQQYTKQPDEILKEADELLDMRNWTEAEKRDYDKREREIEKAELTLAAARDEGLEEGLVKGRAEGRAEGLEKGREEGREEGLAEGIEQGKLETFVSLVNKGLLSTELAAKELGISISEFEKYL